jgi:hypothetical protein
VPANFNSDMLAKYGQSSIMVIPRWATRIYFDVSTPRESQKEHNSFYGPKCIGRKSGALSAPARFGSDFSWELQSGVSS